jgi:hypothetical protein
VFGRSRRMHSVVNLFVQKDIQLEAAGWSIRAAYYNYETTYVLRDSATKRLFSFDRHYFEHFRVLSGPSAGLPVGCVDGVDFALDSYEPIAPDVVLFSHAAVWTAASQVVCRNSIWAVFP